MVYVLAANGTPLMPTSRYGKVRRILKDVSICREPNVFFKEPNVFFKEPKVFLAEPKVFLTEPNVFLTELNVFFSGTYII